jgi:two-component system, chemotaxis family, chemotaxis protein CheY
METRVLIVDDSLVARMAIKSFLKETGASIREAATGEDALAALADGFSPAVIFLDLTMPGMGGLEALKFIKDKYLDIRVVVITADVQGQTLSDLGELGVAGVIRKPADKTAVLAAYGRASQRDGRT